MTTIDEEKRLKRFQQLLKNYRWAVANGAVDELQELEVKAERALVNFVIRSWEQKNV